LFHNLQVIRFFFSLTHPFIVKIRLYIRLHVSAPQSHHLASTEEQIHTRLLYNWDPKSLQCWSIIAYGVQL